MAYIRFTNDGWYTRKPLDEVLDGSVRVADACAQVWHHDHAGSVVYVGYDTRAGSAGIARAVAGTLSAAGFGVVMPQGPCPMPAIDCAIAADDEAAGGLIVGADHRPASYNGIRVRDAHGRAVNEDEAGLLERLMAGAVAPGDGPVTVRDLVSPFLAHIRRSFDLGDPAGLPLCVIDPLYGTARGVLADFLSGWGLRVVQIHGDALGDFGGLHPDAVEPWVDECERAVRSAGKGRDGGAVGPAVGFAIDCPANRVAVIDDRGCVVPPPKVHALVMAHLVEDKGMAGRVVVPRTISSVVRRQAERLGQPVITVNTDRVWARDEVDKGGVLTTADVLGGLKVPSIDPTRDAFVTVLSVLELIAAKKRPLSELVAELDDTLGATSYGARSLRLDAAQVEVLRNILPGLNPGEVLGKEPVRMSHALGLEMRFDDDSWFLVRTSESEPLVRILAEAPDRAQRDALFEAAEGIVGAAVKRS